METSLTNLSFEVTKFEDPRCWRMEVRLVPNADGAPFAKLKSPPSGLRRAGIREVPRPAPSGVGRNSSVNEH